jgi:hypothetical protein
VLVSSSKLIFPIWVVAHGRQRLFFKIPSAPQIYKFFFKIANDFSQAMPDRSTRLRPMWLGNREVPALNDYRTSIEEAVFGLHASD